MGRYIRKFMKIRILPRKLDRESRIAIDANIAEGASGSRRFYVLLLLSTTIAAFGLLANSTAVIIGAMIVAPLMGPILGLSLGMVSGNHRLERDSLFAEVTGVALAIGIGIVVGHFPLKLGVSAEMLARTSPTVYDLCIAIASGLAGGYASVNSKINSAFAGVAIAVALVPPLATCGLLVAMGYAGEAFGAFLLFLANFFCIQIAAAVVFAVFGFGRNLGGTKLGASRIAIRFSPGIAALALMTWYMTGTLERLVRDHQTEETIRKTLSSQIARRTGGRLEQIIRREDRDGTYHVVASALTPGVFQAEQVAQIEADLSRALHRPVSLVLRSIVSLDMNREGRVYLTDEEREQSKQSLKEASYLDSARKVISKALASVQGAWLTDLERSEEDGNVVLTATVQGPFEVLPATVADVQRELTASLDDHVRLIVRNVRTRDVEASGFLYEPPEAVVKPDPLAAALRQRIQAVLRIRMSSKPARRMSEVDVRSSENFIDVNARVEATVPVRPVEVAAIQTDLRKYVDRRIRLSIHTELAATANGSGWVTE